MKEYIHNKTGNRYVKVDDVESKFKNESGEWVEVIIYINSPPTPKLFVRTVADFNSSFTEVLSE